MRIIKQFKEGSTPTDILKRMKPGDVIKIESVLYLRSEKGVIVSEYGTLWDVSTLGDLCDMSELKCVVRHVTGDMLIDALIVAERGYI